MSDRQADLTLSRPPSRRLLVGFAAGTVLLAGALLWLMAGGERFGVVSQSVGETMRAITAPPR